MNYSNAPSPDNATVSVRLNGIPADTGATSPYLSGVHITPTGVVYAVVDRADPILRFRAVTPADSPAWRMDGRYGTAVLTDISQGAVGGARLQGPPRPITADGNDVILWNISTSTAGEFGIEFSSDGGATFRTSAATNSNAFPIVGGGDVYAVGFVASEGFTHYRSIFTATGGASTKVAVFSQRRPVEMAG